MTYEHYFLVTGGAGFIGSHFLVYFAEKYPHYHFTCIDKLNYATTHTRQTLTKVEKKANYRFIQCDISLEYDILYDLLVRRFPDTKITSIINFAAESSVDRSFTNPSAFVRNNILATQNLLECLRLALDKFPQNRFTFIHISTDEVYGESENDPPVSELAALHPTNPYAASKASVDMIIQSYYSSYKVPVVILRPNNVYGSNQYPEKLIPMAIAKLRDGQKIHIHGDGTNKRTYLHVIDLVRAIEIIWRECAIAKSDMVTGGIFNVGTKDEWRNKDLVAKLIEIYHGASIDLANHLEFVADRKYNDARYRISSEKIQRLGWEPQVNFLDGLESLVNES